MDKCRIKINIDKISIASTHQIGVLNSHHQVVSLYNFNQGLPN